jgi:phage shock protein E
MKLWISLLTLTFVSLLFIASAPDQLSGVNSTLERGQSDPVNPAIDMDGYLQISGEAASYRATRRLSEAEFIKMSHEPGTIILDARSKQRYDELHIKGAVNLSFPDITVDSLKQLIPDKATRILIYCNNNFLGAETPFPTKMSTASLNISTYISLYDYGYRNVYELGPLLDVNSTNLEFEGTWLDAQ